MKFFKIVQFSMPVVAAFGILLTSCQKMDRPELKEIMFDPEPPPYEPLKSLFSFDNNVTDEGENDLTATPTNTSYVAGIKGQALKFGTGGYLLLPGKGDTTRYPNEFVGLPFDTLANPGSLTIAFWMNAPGPFTDGAQGIFSFSKRTEFWGNFDMFLENYNNAADQTEAFIKMHMFNAGVASGNGENWIEVKVTNVFNKWTHIAVTYDAATSTLNIYRDGQVTDVSNRVLGGGSYGKLRFGDFNGLVLGTFQFQTSPSLGNADAQGWASSFKGPLDQFRIYNKALTASEINQLFTAQD